MQQKKIGSDMIAQLTGKLLYKSPSYVILEVGGVGYELHISLATFADVKPLDFCTLLSTIYIKSEVVTLYGFSTLEEKAWWLRLIGVNGIGPKTALVILSSLSPIELHQTILNKQEHLLTAIKGIGLKVAQRLILELTGPANKLHSMAYTQDLALQAEAKLEQDAVMALTVLGISQKAAEKAVSVVKADRRTPLTLEELVKKALQST